MGVLRLWQPGVIICTFDLSDSPHSGKSLRCWNGAAGEPMAVILNTGTSSQRCRFIFHRCFQKIHLTAELLHFSHLSWRTSFSGRWKRLNNHHTIKTLNIYLRKSLLLLNSNPPYKSSEWMLRHVEEKKSKNNIFFSIKSLFKKKYNMTFFLKILWLYSRHLKWFFFLTVAIILHCNLSCCSFI